MTPLRALTCGPASPRCLAWTRADRGHRPLRRRRVRLQGHAPRRRRCWPRWPPRRAGRPVKLALTRQQMFAVAGYRTPTIQRIRLGADADGRLTAIAHDVVEQTRRIKEFAEQTAVATRTMYAAPNRAPPTGWPRSTFRCPPGCERPASAGHVRPRIRDGRAGVGLRHRPGRAADPQRAGDRSGDGAAVLQPQPRRLPARGSAAFRVGRADPGRAASGRGGWLVGTGVAASTFPVLPPPRRQIRYRGDGVDVAAWTPPTSAPAPGQSLTQIAADALERALAPIDGRDRGQRPARGSVAGGWRDSLVGLGDLRGGRQFRDKHGEQPGAGRSDRRRPAGQSRQRDYAMHAFGAQFAEVRVNADTGEVRVPRLLGVFAAGRIINPSLARSQFLGGMTMGLSMALHEQSVVDPRFGHVVNHDFADYHIAANADVGRST